MKRTTYGLALASALSTLTVTAAQAQTEILWWHAMGDRLNELLDEQAAQFNASQSDYVVVPTYKGNYSETLNAGIAAFRAGEQPHVLQVFEVGTATMMAAEGAINPVYQLMADSGADFDPGAYLAATGEDGANDAAPYIRVALVNDLETTRAGLAAIAETL